MFGFPELVLAQVVLLGYSFYWMLKRNDEIPLLINSCLFYIGCYPYWAVQQGFRSWINLTVYGLNPITDETALAALNCIVLGQVCLILAYQWRQNQTIPVAKPSKDDPLLKQIAPFIMLLAAGCFPLVFLAKGIVSSQRRSGLSAAFQISGYLSSFSLVLIGVATLVLCLWRMGALKSILFKLLAIAIMYGVANMSFNISGRFQFLGVIATGGVIISSTYKPRTRLLILMGAALFGASLFAIAGAMRAPIADEMVNEFAFNRFIEAEDANMVDGMATLRDAFPRLVGFRWGMAHVEIILRMVPRAWWPGKPIGGGYLAAVGLIDVEKGTTLGFSPTLFGDFYSEAGIFGIIALSIVYGAGIASIVRYSVGLKPFASVLVRSLICSSLVPLLRGGDLAGIYAWLGMSFWPCLLLLYFKRKDLKMPPLDWQPLRSRMPNGGLPPRTMPPGTMPAQLAAPSHPTNPLDDL